MLDFHHKGKAVVSRGTKEKSELDVFQLHEYGLLGNNEAGLEQNGDYKT
ncbi:MAG: hypothetical protein CM15mP49_20570 [Actinomycetota bacterium]|nr:MAG: hypothetical protein CM15mP49_20570 [Actinomycetota bacterium]